MMCPQCSDFLKPGATHCGECGWGKVIPRRDRESREERPSAWSPPTPHVRDLPGWHAKRPEGPLPAELQAALSALYAKLSSAAIPSGRVLDPEHVRRYLAKCEAKKAAKLTQTLEEARS